MHIKTNVIRIDKMVACSIKYIILNVKHCVNCVSSGDYEIDCKTPAYGRSGIVKSTFYARNGIFNIPTATDQLG